MAVEYISYIQTENLIKNWPTIQGIKESLALEIKALGNEINSDELDDYIYSQAVGNKVLTDTPPSGKISDTTCNVAASYQQVMKRDYSETYESIKREKFCIDLVDDKLNVAFRRLLPLQEKIIKLFYWDKKTWAEVMEILMKEKHFISKDQAQMSRRNSIEKIQKISKITVDMYEFVIKLVEVE